MRTIRLVLALLTATTVLAGCNTMTEQSFQEIDVVTQGVEGADCKLKNDGRIYHVVTPMRIIVDRSPNPLYVHCTKEYYKDYHGKVHAGVDMWDSTLNVFNGVVPGTAYDIASNSIHDYPSTISIAMEWDEAAYQAKMSEYADEPTTVKRKPPPEVNLPLVDPIITPQGDKAFDSGLNK